MQSNDLVLVTGATGFIGGRLVEKLIREHGVRVRVLTSQLAHCSRPARFSVELFHGDLADPATLTLACSGCTTVFHAAYSSADSRLGHLNDNVVGSLALAAAARAAGVGRFVHFSSVSVYGETSDGTLDENTPVGPSGGDHYIETKSCVEDALLKFQRETGFSLVVLQPTVVYGPYAGAWTVGPLQQVKEHRVVLPRLGEGLCNAVYVDDVVEAAILAAKHTDLAGERFLISGPQPVTWREFFGAYENMSGLASVETWTTESVAAEMKHLSAVKPLPIALAAAIRRRPVVMARLLRIPTARWAYALVRYLIPERSKSRLRDQLDGQLFHTTPTGKPLLLPNSFSLPLYHPRTAVSVAKARRLLGYEPQFDFANGMAHTAEWARWARLINDQG